MKKLFKFIFIFSLIVLSPVPSLAVVPDPFQPPAETQVVCAAKIAKIGDVICNIGQFLNSLVPVLGALGMVYFVWGVVNFMIADGEEAKTKGKDQMIYGVIGFAVIVGLWGLVKILTNTFGVDSGTFPLPPTTACPVITNGATIKSLIDYVTCIIANSIIPLLFAGAALMFIWGVINFFIINAEEEAKREQGRQFMIWGIVALAVMISVWGLVGIVGNTFGIKTDVLPTVTPPKQ